MIDFWMEPNETYHLGAALVLARGVYLAKATFVAAGGDDNFWSRVTAIEVPTAADSAPVSGALRLVPGGSPER